MKHSGLLVMLSVFLESQGNADKKLSAGIAFVLVVLAPDVQVRGPLLARATSGGFCCSRTELGSAL